MNTIPLIIPPSSPLRRMMPAKKPTLLVTVLVVLAVHVIFLASLLIQGCQRENVGAAFGENYNLAALLPSSSVHSATPSTTPPATPATGSIPARLAQHTPAPTSAASESVSPMAMAGDAPAPSSAVIHTVKPGDSLSKIAKVYGTTVKAIQTDNSLKSDRLAPGQKLRIPPRTIEAGKQ
jgi:LysM repeat protein